MFSTEQNISVKSSVKVKPESKYAKAKQIQFKLNINQIIKLSSSVPVGNWSFHWTEIAL